jgi:peptidoglycan/LPS O-acetylase OafA/YrhL
MTARFEVLDSFRGICAVCVVMYHLHWVGSIAELDFFRGSGIFVEFFFVLSGFVLAHGYGYRETVDFRAFVRSRFFRLYPMHLVMLLVFVLFEFGKLLVADGFGIGFNNPAFSGDYAPGEILPNLFLLHAWTPWSNPLSFNTPSWSISIEFYTYLVFFVTIACARRFALLLWAIVPPLVLLLAHLEATWLMSTVARGLSCFFGGAACYVVYRQVNGRLRQIDFPLASGIEIVMLGLVILLVQSDAKFRALAALPLFCATVFCFALERGVVSRGLRQGFFQLLGRLSYSIYMIHAAVIYLLTSIVLVLQKLTGIELAPMIDGVRFFDSGSSLLNNLAVVAILAAVVYLSVWTHRWIEVRGQQLGKAIFSRRKPVLGLSTS